MKTGFLQQVSATKAFISKVSKASQAYSGFFQLLPLGFRVQEKIERLVDKHMRNLGKMSLAAVPANRAHTKSPAKGASKLSLSSISSESLWMQSGRLKGDKSEVRSIYAFLGVLQLTINSSYGYIVERVRNISWPQLTKKK